MPLGSTFMMKKPTKNAQAYGFQLHIGWRKIQKLKSNLQSFSIQKVISHGGNYEFLLDEKPNLVTSCPGLNTRLH